MRFHKRKAKHLDPEAIQLTDDLVALIWASDGEDAEARQLRFGVGRVNRNGGRPFRTLRPEHLVQLPEFLRALAKGLAESPDLPADLRVELRKLAQTPPPVSELADWFSPATAERLRGRRDDGSEPGGNGALRF